MSTKDPGSSGIYERVAAVETNLARMMDSDRRKQGTLDTILEKVNGIDDMVRGAGEAPGIKGRLDRLEQDAIRTGSKSNKAILSAIAAGAVVGVKVVFDWMTGGHPSAH